MTDQQLLDAARAGDEDAYERIVAVHRRELQAHCYRMLGSAEDAEDALQEALVRAWRGLPRFEGRSSLRSWLYRIATNACLRLAERRRPLVLPVDFGPAADPHEDPTARHEEPIWMQPYPGALVADGRAAPDARYEQRESVELAFVAALQHLPPRQRAVLILRDVLGFSGGEVAAALDASTASVHSALQRAHATIDARLPARSQQATLRTLGEPALRELAERFTAAWEGGDVDAIVTLLTEDATISMPPYAVWFAGRDAVAGFLRRGPLAGRVRWRLLPASANGQLAFAFYVSEDGGPFVAHGIDVLDLDGARISAFTAFIDRAAVTRFGLPDQLRPEGTDTASA
jgi:RNA polymerase sigma-70 factor (ECF subfamily)